MPEQTLSWLRLSTWFFLGGLTALNLPMPAALAAQQAAFAHCEKERFPPAWAWAGRALAHPRAATEGDSLSPRVEQIRDGKVVARYQSLGSTGQTSDFYRPGSIDTRGGAFSRRPHQNYQAGDVFLVYPAVYRGADQQPWIGPQVPDYQAYQAKAFVIPRQITIRGVTVNGIRPVIRLEGESTSDNTLGQAALYIDRAEDITIENIDIDGRGAVHAGKAGVYINGARNVRLRNMRIHGFRGAEANGVFSTVETSGTLRLENLILFDNGGDNGPEHNVYINDSHADPDFTVEMRGSHSSDVYYGHLFKSRAQRTVLEGNFFHGNRPSSTKTQAEAYLVDVPDGGQLVMRNNILVKDQSGENSNGALLSYAAESLRFKRNSVRIEHNTFVALSRNYDGRHPLQPFLFRHLDPRRAPANVPVKIDANAFVGFCPDQGEPPYTGARAYLSGFAGIHTDYRLPAAPSVDDTDIVGSPAYQHQATSDARTSSIVGARD